MAIIDKIVLEVRTPGGAARATSHKPCVQRSSESLFAVHESIRFSITALTFIYHDIARLSWSLPEPIRFPPRRCAHSRAVFRTRWRLSSTFWCPTRSTAKRSNCRWKTTARCCCPRWRPSSPAPAVWSSAPRTTSWGACGWPMADSTCPTTNGAKRLIIAFFPKVNYHDDRVLSFVETVPIFAVTFQPISLGVHLY